jgi:hypothetical protein
MLFKERYNRSYFDGYCPPVLRRRHTNPSVFCDLTPKEVIVYKWGGEMLRSKRVLCDKAVITMKELLLTFDSQYKELELGLIIPENIENNNFLIDGFIPLTSRKSKRANFFLTYFPFLKYFFKKGKKKVSS